MGFGGLSVGGYLSYGITWRAESAKDESLGGSNAVDGQAVGSVDQFMTIVETRQPGDEVVVTVIRDRQREDVKVVLGGEN